MRNRFCVLSVLWIVLWAVGVVSAIGRAGNRLLGEIDVMFHSLVLFVLVELLLYAGVVLRVAYCEPQEEDIMARSGCLGFGAGVFTLFFKKVQWLLFSYGVAWVIAVCVLRVQVGAAVIAIGAGWLALWVVYGALLIPYGIGRALFEREEEKEVDEIDENR